jgi:hypothetical protein
MELALVRPEQGAVSKPELHILHIGKTGGTALQSALKPHAQAGPFAITFHTHNKTLADVPAGESVVLFLRHPVSRFVSGFYSRQREGRPRTYRPWSQAERQAFSMFASASALARALASKSAIGEEARAAMHAIRHVRDSFYDWIVSDDYFHARRYDIFFVGFQEKLAEDLTRLSALLGISAMVELPVDDIAAHRNPPGVDRDLEPMALANLQSWYFRDIELYMTLFRNRTTA